MAIFQTLVRQINEANPGYFADWSNRSLSSTLWPAIPTGIFMLDYLTGIGGIPRKKITEFFGPESGGKSTAALETARETQDLIASPEVAAQYGMKSCNADLAVLYVDAEHDFDPKYARKLGVSLSDSKFALLQPNSAEEGYDTIKLFMDKCDNLGLVIVDSTAAMIPQDQINAIAGESQPGINARMLGTELGKLRAKISASQAAMIFISQIRSIINIGGRVNPNAPKTQATGGRALKFYAALRVEFTQSSVKLVTVEDVTGSKQQAIGHDTRMTVVKNKCGPPKRSGESFMRYGVGYDSLTTLIVFANSLGILKKSQNGFYRLYAPYSTTGPEQSFRGEDAVRDYFKSYPEKLALLNATVLAELQKMNIEVDVDPTEAEDLAEAPVATQTTQQDVKPEDLELLKL